MDRGVEHDMEDVEDVEERVDGNQDFSDDGEDVQNLAANGGPVENGSPGSTSFPVSRVRRVIKSESDIAMVGTAATYLITKAAEMFLEDLVENAFQNMCEDDRTSIAYKDISSTVANEERLEFLADFVPEKVSASKALAEAPFQIS